ncbi:Usually multiple acids move in and out Transporters 40 [Hibiscus trionum]|uniref:WAT1-related protein n=1 Tax=Hibiscus trionum TaxID=183268 RepID=A0A9W7GWW2_HIBTR|nr:Usually multiple acids move in and out Transporters 40 [Hibiscus trionum]GMI67057.1 Usually multiple acids move in and out Transporters 40 [Hibiscus trionum]GMI67060.1 Usually multiple acids move in and out Transporters 40 [Hibiscus trionum]GMI67063.1 Usually multiple acids move in and out Transporters 40 [Hibiscus trionum]GMI67066.1 Usually multiple acids move in and out Transporters 40 [Hibiscus trionum]
MEVLPSLAMVAVECSNVVVNILFKAASSKGLSYYTFVTYCFFLGSFVFIPLIFFRKTEFPPLKLPLISRLCLLGLTGCLTRTFSAKAVELSSPTLSSAVSNLLPAFTFILAVFFRMEKVEFRRSSTQAKIIGTITSISGALVMTFYKGPQIISSSPRTTSLSSSVLEFQRPLGSSESNWIIGGILEAVAYLILSFWCIIQAQVLKMYPEEIAVNLFYNLSAALVSLPISLVAEPELTSWRLTSSVSVVAVLYSGLFGFSFSSAVHIWCIHLKGPVFVASFRPISIVIAAAMGATFLGEAVHLGSVIGAVIITGGLYAVLWGKAKEEELNRLGTLSSDQAPLLQSYKS